MIDKTAYVISLCKDDIAVIHGLIQDRSRELEHILCQLEEGDPIPQDVDSELYALENLGILFTRLMYESGNFIKPNREEGGQNDKDLCDFARDITIHPGLTVQENLDYHNMSVIDLASRIKVAPEYINGILDGKAPITPEVAVGLEKIFSAPYSFWINLERNYAEKLTGEQKLLRLRAKSRNSPFFKAHLKRVKNMPKNADEILRNIKLEPPLSEDVRKGRDND